ncbi:MAG TPA: hypothetical protein VHE83_14095 [Mycobacteriales bacterium]|nr:hypothetical protein [Mycobacteriales bacterium]
MRSRGGWVGPPDAPIAAAWTFPDRAGGPGVVVLPPFGYELSSTHRTVRRLAEELADRGCTVLRIDHPCTGDSAGRSADVTLSALRAAVAPAVAALRARGCERIVVAGLRLGATIALLEAAAVGADAVVAWVPIASGRRYGREIGLLGARAPDGVGLPDGTVVAAGTPYPGAFLAELATIDLADGQPAAPAPQVLVLDRDDRATPAAVIEALTASGAAVTHTSAPGHDRFLDRPAEDAEVAPEPVAVIVDWVAAHVDGGAAAAADEEVRAAATIPWDGGAVTETFVTVGDRELRGVLTSAVADARTTLVFFNSGSDPHTGPARAWVEYARSLALRGGRSDVDVLRVDFTGWGDSPPDPRATGRPYDQHTIEDVTSVVDALHAEGRHHVVVAGLCAGAWIAMAAARTAPIDGLLVLNPQLYWQPGDIIEALMSDTRARRMPEILEIRDKAADGVWDAADAAGERPPAGEWLDELAARGVVTSLLFAEGDDGLEYLGDRLGRRIAELQATGRLRILEMEGVDHGMSRVWLRPQVIDVIAAELDEQRKPEDQRTRTASKGTTGPM